MLNFITHVLVLVMLAFNVPWLSAARFEYKDGQIWKLLAVAPSNHTSNLLEGKKTYVKLLEDIQQEFPELLFWSGHDISEEPTSFAIFTSPPTMTKILESSSSSYLQDLFSSNGLHLQRYIEPEPAAATGYLKEWGHVLSIPPEKVAKGSLLSSLADVTANAYVVHTGTLYISYQIDSFKYDESAYVMADDLKRPIDIVHKITVPNNSSSTVSVTVSEARTLIQRLTLSFTESLSIGGTASISLNVPEIGIGGSAGISLTIELSATQTVEYEEDFTYAISKTILILPYTTIKAHGYVNWVDGLELPFEACARIIPSLRNLNNGSGSGSGNGTSITGASTTSSAASKVPPRLYYCPIQHHQGTGSTGSTSTTLTWPQCYSQCGRNPCNPTCIHTNACTCCMYEINEKNMWDPFVLRDYLIASGENDFEIVEGDDIKGRKGLFIKFYGNVVANYGADVVFIVEDA